MYFIFHYYTKLVPGERLFHFETFLSINFVIFMQNYEEKLKKPPPPSERNRIIGIVMMEKSLTIDRKVSDEKENR